MAGEPLPPRSPSQFESVLREALARRRPGPPRVRLVRAQGARAIVEVEHSDAASARDAWNGPLGPIELRTVRTWGTLVGAKAWLAGRRRAGPRPPPP